MNRTEQTEIEREIERARDSVGNRIDELDRRLRKQFDLQAYASEHAVGLVTGGAVVGFLAGFGFPKLLKRAMQIGLPLALIAFKVAKARETRAGGGHAAARRSGVILRGCAGIKTGPLIANQPGTPEA